VWPTSLVALVWGVFPTKSVARAPHSTTRRQRCSEKSRTIVCQPHIRVSGVLAHIWTLASSHSMILAKSESGSYFVKQPKNQHDAREGRMKKKEYRAPEIKSWGTVAELTATGMTNPGSDAKSGSAASQGE
jgi:hypothetical protein